MKKFMRAAVAASAVAGLSLIGMAAPAQATTTAPTLPTGYKMLAVGCDYLNNANVWQIDPVTGSSTSLGTPSDITDPNDSTSHMNCAGQGTYNPVSKKSYYVGWNAGDTFLGLVDPTNGSSTRAANIPENGCVLATNNQGTMFQWVEPSAATNSNVVNNTMSNPNNSYVLQSVDETTGVETNIAPIEDAGATFNFSGCAMAINPVDNFLYAFSLTTTNSANTNSSREIWKIDTTTGAATDTMQFVDNSALTTHSRFCPDAMAIDTNGIAWVQDDCYGQHDGLVAVNLATGESWDMAPGTFDANHTLYPTADQITNSENAEGWFYQMSIWLVPTEESSTTTPALANTGSESGSLVAIAGLIALLGAVTLVASRRRTN